MIVKILGIMDLVALTTLLLVQLDVGLGWRFPAALALYLIAKGIYFWGDFSSFIDMGIGAYMVLMLLGTHTFIAWICMAFLAQKICFSMLRF